MGRMTTHRRAKTLLGDRDLQIRLSWYDPGEVMAVHTHQFGQVSVLLAGSFREISDGRNIDNHAAHIGYKPARLAHANLYGDTGALILAIDFGDRDYPAARQWGWQPARAEQFAMTRQIVSGELAVEELRNSALDLTASAMPRQANDRKPARWAVHLRDKLRDEHVVDLAATARQIGIHPAHLSRGFREWFGAPPSVYALRCRMGRAVQALASGESAAMAAESAGFADQSHFIRTLKRETGLTPKRLVQAIAG
jgi:AraC family transcriptional regulator